MWIRENGQEEVLEVWRGVEGGVKSWWSEQVRTGANNANPLSSAHFMLGALRLDSKKMQQPNTLLPVSTLIHRRGRIASLVSCADSAVDAVNTDSHRSRHGVAYQQRGSLTSMSVSKLRVLALQEA